MRTTRVDFVVVAVVVVVVVVVVVLLLLLLLLHTLLSKARFPTENTLSIFSFLFTPVSLTSRP